MASSNANKPRAKKTPKTESASDAVLESVQSEPAIETASEKFVAEAREKESVAENKIEAAMISEFVSEKIAEEEDLTDSSKYLLRVRNLKKYFPIKTFSGARRHSLGR